MEAAEHTPKGAHRKLARRVAPTAKANTTTEPATSNGIRRPFDRVPDVVAAEAGGAGDAKGTPGAGVGRSDGSATTVIGTVDAGFQEETGTVDGWGGDPGGKEPLLETLFGAWDSR